MRILLIGEYSRLHNSLKEGLVALGHDVTLIGNGDGFKNYPVDLNISHSFQSKFLRKINTAIHKLTTINLAAWEIYIKTKFHSNRFKNFDVVQLINESSIKTSPRLESKFLKQIFKHNKKVFLLSCGIDHQCVQFMMDNKFRYSIMSPYLNDKSLYELYQFQLQYLNTDFTNLHQYLYNNINGVIASDIDYHIPLLGNENYLGLIPNPINIDKIEYLPMQINDKIKIFHGINREAIIKKGTAFFTKALEIIQNKYGNKVDITITYDIPYKDYIKRYNNCHILLDQIYAYDQGYNALEAMAKGKVVFTGAEQEWLDYYNLTEDTVAINTLPNAEYIAEKIEHLILNPEKLIEISHNARRFIEDNHRFDAIAENYVEIWNNN